MSDQEHSSLIEAYQRAGKMSMDSVTGSQLLSTLSQGSSPRMLDSDQISMKSEDENSNSSDKVKLMCSYGGKIMLRPHDSQLRYIGGDTRILVVPRSISFSDLCVRLAKLCGGRSVFPKYKLPYEDYDALVSVISDEDLETMLDEYDSLGARDTPSRLRLFLFPRVINPKMPSLNSFDLAKNEQTFLEALNGTIQEQQQQQMNLSLVQQEQQQDIFFPIEACAGQQEVIIDGPGASACSSASSVVQKIIDSDTVLQCDLPPILTSVNHKNAAPPVNAAAEAPAPANPRPVSPYLEPEFMLPLSQLTQIQPRIVPPPQQLQPPPILSIQKPISAPPQPISMSAAQQPISVPQQPMPILPEPIAMPQQPMPMLQEPIAMLQQPISPPIQQILPPRGPKPRVSSPKSGDGIKEKKEKNSKLGSPKNMLGKVDLEPSIIVEALENLKLGEPKIEPDEDFSAKPGLVSSDVNPVVSSNPFEVTEMSLNVFMEQQKIQENEQKKLLAKIQQDQLKQQQQMQSQQIQAQQLFVQQSPALVQPSQQQLFVQQSPALVQPSQQQQGIVHQGQYYQQYPQQHPQQPYIIENNMVYYLPDGNTAGTHQQFIQRPVIHPGQFQRGGSGPLVARQQPPLQRQVSAAYPDQFQQQQVLLQQPQQVYPTRMQSPSRFREQIPMPQQQQAGLARGQAYEIDPGLVVVSMAQQQLPYSAAP